jgi:hypothetical protein
MIELRFVKSRKCCVIMIESKAINSDIVGALYAIICIHLHLFACACMLAEYSSILSFYLLDETWFCIEGHCYFLMCCVMTSLDFFSCHGYPYCYYALFFSCPR